MKDLQLPLWKAWIFGLLFGCISVPRVTAQKYVFHYLRQEQGLGNLNIEALARDGQGFLWIGTQGGLYRFLGSGFIHYGPEDGLADGYIHTVLFSPDGEMWVAGRENLYHFNGLGFDTVSQSPLGVRSSNNTVFTGAHTLLLVHNRELLEVEVGRDHRATSIRKYLSPGQIEKHPSLERLNGVSVLPDGTIWLGCGSGICSIRGNDIREYSGQDGVPPETWRAAFADSRGSVWIASQSRVAELPRGGSHFVDRTPPSQQSGAVYDGSPLVEDQQGRILVAAGNELARWNGSEWQLINRLNGFDPSHPNAMIFGPEGDLWIGTSGQGLVQWAGYRSWESWTSEQGLLDNNIWSLSPDTNGDLLIGTGAGPEIYHHDGRTVDPLVRPADWHLGQVSKLFRDSKARLWATTFAGGLLELRSGSRGLNPVGDRKEVRFGIEEAPDGTLWQGGDDGISRLELHGASVVARPDPITHAESEDDRRAFASCHSSDGSLWFLTRNALFRRFDNRWIRYGIQSFTAKPQSWNSVACSASGDPWILSDSSILIHLHVTGEHIVPESIQIPAALSQFQTIALYLDHRNWVWIGSDNGVIVSNGNHWAHITQEDGLIWNDINQGAIAEDIQGGMWIGTSGGLSHLTNPEMLFAGKPLTVAVAIVQRGSKYIDANVPAIFPSSAEPLRIRFASPSLRDHGPLKYQYRLLGLSNQWVVTRSSEAVFTSLDGGSYIFEVLAVDTETGLTSVAARYAFRILPPWWRTSPMYALYFVAICCCALGAMKLRTSQLERSRMALELVVQQRTKELEDSRAELERQATRDSLTGLWNRSSILDLLAKEMERAIRNDSKLLVVMVDLDHFKQINDTFGHMAGDEALRQFATAVASSIRSYDHAGRLGGEEFLLVLPSERWELPEERISTLHSEITNLTIRTSAHAFTLTTSCGVTCFLADGAIDMNEILSRSDHALYAAKQSGRNCFVYVASTPLPKRNSVVAD